MPPAVRCIALWLVVSSCEPVSAPAVAGVSVEVVSADARLPRSARTGFRAGDWLLRNESLRAVVGAADPRPGHSDPRGLLVDLAPGRIDRDELEGLETFVEIGGRKSRVAVRRSERTVRAGRSTVRVTGSAFTTDGRVEVVTEIGLGPRDRAIGIRTTVTNVGTQRIRVRVADAIEWGDAPAFAPGLGEATRWQEARVPFFARAGGDVAYAWASPDGDVDARFEVAETGSQKVFARVVARLPAVTLASRARATFRRRLVAVRGGLGAAAAVAWHVRGTETRTVRGKAPGLGSGGHVRAQDLSGRTVLRVPVAPDGGFALPLPLGTYRVVAASFGRRPTPQRVVEVGARAPWVEMPTPEAPGRLEYAVVARGTAAPVPCRLVVRGYGDTPDPVLGPPGSAAGSAFVIHAASCVGNVEIPSGRYRVSASHGPEWTALSRVVDVLPGDPTPFGGAIEQAVPTPGWVSADLHVHAIPSPDSPVPLVDRVASLVAEGVEVAAATDHNVVTDYGPVIAGLGVRDRILGIPGDEVTTEGERSFGHFNVFPLVPTPWDPEVSKLPFRDVLPADIFRAAREAPFAIPAPDAGAADAGPESADAGPATSEALGDLRVVQVNHPRGEPSICYFDLSGLDPATGRGDETYDPGFDLVEVWNGIWLGIPERVDASLREQFQLWNLGLRYVATGNSDSHRFLYQWAGWPRNYVEVGDVEVGALRTADVIGALRAGKVFVTNGPIVELKVQGQGPGATVVPTDGRVEVSIRVEAAPWVDVTRVEVVRRGEVVETIGVPPGRRRTTRLDVRRRYEAAAGAWFAVVVRGDAPAPDVWVFQTTRSLAFTNPVWIGGGEE